MPRMRMRLSSALKDCTREYSFLNPCEVSPTARSTVLSVSRVTQRPKTGSRKGARATGSAKAGAW